MAGLKCKLSFLAPGRSCERISYLNTDIYDGTKGEGRIPVCLASFPIRIPRTSSL